MPHQTKIEQNQRIGKSLCSELCLNGIATTGSVLAAGENDEPDIVLQIDGEKVYVEATAYHKGEVEKSAELRESTLSETFAKTARDTSDMYGYSLFIGWNEERTRSGNNRIMVPEKPDHCDVVAEIRRMVNSLRELPVWARFGEVAVSLDDAQQSRDMNEFGLAGPTCMFWSFNRAEYPILARHCKYINVHETLPHHPACLNSDLNSRAIGGDPDVARGLVVKKCEKIDNKRKQSGGSKCWLVLHSDGYPLSTIISGDDVAAMCEVARAEMANYADTYDKAFWLNLDAPSGKGRLRQFWPMQTA